MTSIDSIGRTKNLLKTLKDSCFDIPKPIADACRRQVIKWFEMATSRISEVLLNSINPQVRVSKSRDIIHVRYHSRTTYW